MIRTFLKIFIVIIFTTFTAKAFCQDYKYTYYLNADLASVPKDNAILIGKSYMQNGNWVLDCFLATSGIKIISTGVKDSLLSSLHGTFKSYFTNARIESQGPYYENQMDGVWQNWNEDGLMTDSAVYNKGIRVAYTKYNYHYNKPFGEELLPLQQIKDSLYEYTYSFTDSFSNTFKEEGFIIKNKKTRLSYEVNFMGKRGLLKDYDSTGNLLKEDSVFTREKREAEYPGGEVAWRNFLKNNLNSMVLVDNNAPSGKYTTVVKFIVNIDGKLEDIKVENDPGYGTAAEALRVIKKSGKWNPAFNYGKYTKAYRRQPITLFISN